MAQNFSSDRSDAEVDRPEREPEQAREEDEGAGGQRPAERDAAQRPLGPAGETSPQAAGVRH